MSDGGPGTQLGNALVDPVVPWLPELDPLDVTLAVVDPADDPTELAPLVPPVLVPVLPVGLAPVPTTPVAVLIEEQQPPKARSAASGPAVRLTISASGPQA